PPEAQQYTYQALVNSLEGLTDTMMLIRFNPDTQQLVVLSLPRDTRVDIEGYGIEKLNAANYYGGPALSAKTVSRLLGGVPIDRYIRINVQGVEKLINALGGVTVYVPHDMKYRDDSQHLYINLKAGKQRLNGNQALQLLRFRHDENGDIGRIQRQQMVIRALKEQALNPTTIARLPQILKVIQAHIDTNLSVEELMALVGFSASLSKANTQMLLLPGDFSLPGEYGASYWLPNYAKIGDMTARYFGLGFEQRSYLQPSQVRISIQDSTGNRQAVNLLVKTLQRAGYTDISVDKPWTEQLSVTRVVAQSGNALIAQAVRDVLNVGDVRVESTGILQSDVTIQLGKDWVVSAGLPNNY
ncbi:MAG: LCP family protein, partial [Cyanobacteria bacterium]|nr:LCP family protein [Cyanobacteriota bacterium]MDW8203095.1 LCP family protein [Cyanobacteriota bacterium SKYGB_h_bin112]